MSLLKESLALMPGHAREHWSLPEPREEGLEEAKGAAFKIETIRSKHGSTYQFKIKGTFRGERIWGETTSAHMHVDKIGPRLAERILPESKLHRESQKDFPYSLRKKIEKAVLAELMKLAKKHGSDMEETVAGMPGEFAVTEPDEDFQTALDDVRDRVRSPRWEYPDWTLPKGRLNEVSGKAPFDELKSGLLGYLKGGTSIRVMELAYSFDASPQKIEKYLDSLVKQGKLKKARHNVGTMFKRLGLYSYSLAKGSLGEHETLPIGSLDEAIEPKALTFLKQGIRSAEARMNEVGRKYGAKFKIRKAGNTFQIVAWIEGSGSEARDVANIFLGPGASLDLHKLVKNKLVAKQTFKISSTIESVEPAPIGSLDESAEFTVSSGYGHAGGKVRIGIKWDDGDVTAYWRLAKTPQQAADLAKEMKAKLAKVKTGRQLGQVMDDYGWSE